MSSSYLFATRQGSANLLSHRMVQNPFAVKNATPTRSMMADSTEHKDSRPIIAPPTFTPGLQDADSSRNSVSSSFFLKPPVFSNPFKRTSAPEDKTCEVSTTKDNPSEEEEERVTAGVEYDVENVVISDDDEDESKVKSATNEQTVSESRPFSSMGVGDEMYGAGNTDCRSAHIPSPANLFSRSVATAAATTSGDEFVFGQNMNERVKNAQSSAADSGVCTNGSSPPGLFSQGATEGAKGDTRAEDSVDHGRSGKSLSESALEYEQRQVKRTYDEVVVVTGEEDESNVMQMNCKLFAFDKVTGSWVERGHGLLRLNDKELEGGTLQSRLVMRTQGSLRVILNTKVWGGMSIDRPSPKSVRITTIDGESIKVFLIMASPKDSEQLFGALDWRMATLKSSDDRKGDDPTSSLMCTAGVGTESVGACSTSQDAQGPSASTKKRRVTPPMMLRGDDSSGSSGLEPRLQEKKVDSTRDTFAAGSSSSLDDSCQDLPSHLC